MENLQHKIIIENKSEVIITNASEVLSFNEREIRVKLKSNYVIKIGGENLKIIGFDNVSGNFKLKGNINSLIYKGKDESFIKKVFK